MRRASTATVAAVLAALAFPAAPAGAQDSCEQFTGYESFTLQHDTTCSVLVMRPGLVFDLDGHSMGGIEAYGPDIHPEGGDASNLTVRDGAVDRVIAWNVDGLRLDDVVTEASLSFARAEMTGSTIRSGNSLLSTVTFRDGVLGGMFRFTGDYGCGEWRIDDSVVEDLEMTHECRVTISGSEVGSIGGNADGFPATLTLESNTVSGAVTASGLDTLTLVGNRFEGPAAGVDVPPELLPGRPAVVDIRGNLFSGARGVTIGVSDATYVTFERNVVQNAGGHGLALVDAADATPALRGSVQGNWFLGNGGDGVRHEHDGVAEVPGAYLRFTDNLAVGNAGHGIRAVPDVDIDADGNVAYANGVPPDCVGVVCRSTK